eukprot:3397927-Amphidinium_carterae.1
MNATVESAAHKSASVGILSLDFKKAYEFVRHDRLLLAAIKHQFPLWLLRLAFQLYGGSRYIVWRRQVSPVMSFPGQSIIAGCSLAPGLMQLMLQSLVEVLEGVLDVTNVVDDLNAIAVGSPLEVSSQLEVGIRHTREYSRLEGLVLNEHKCTLVASDSATKRAMQPLIAQTGFRMSDTVKVLGAQLAASKRRHTKVLRTRERGLRRRWSKFSTLRRAGIAAHRMARLHLPLLYAAELRGMGRTQLLALNRAYANTRGKWAKGANV